MGQCVQQQKPPDSPARLFHLIFRFILGYSLSMKLLIGTYNQNKLKQFKEIITRLMPDVELLSLKEVGITDDVAEDGEDLLTNAKKKAEFYGRKSGLLTLSDDLGLFVDALDGEPGLHSKRWHEGTDQERYLKILERMKDVAKEKRTCRYTRVLAVYDPVKKYFWTYEQDLEGYIADEPLEGFGFGYDPIVIVSNFNNPSKFPGRQPEG